MLRNKCESALPNANRDLKKKRGGEQASSRSCDLKLGLPQHAWPCVGFSRGAEGDPHLPSCTFKGSCCTSRAREARRRAEGEAGIFPGNICSGGTRQPPPPGGFLSLSPPPKPSEAFSPPGGASLPAPAARWPGHHPCRFSPLPAGPGRERGAGEGGEACWLLGLVVRGPAAASPPARPGTTVPTWPCAPAHELLGAVAHLLYCLAEDKKKSNWRDYKANVAGAAGAK